jgi:hypothetical protein
MNNNKKCYQYMTALFVYIRLVRLDYSILPDAEHVIVTDSVME